MTCVQLPDARDTIAAPATPAGPGGIAILRVSGPRAWEVGRALFQPRRPWPPGGPRPWRFHLGSLLDADGQAIDEALAVFFRAPRSYTTQDLVELHCHGGPAVLRQALDSALARGCRLARPGEFTLRAFLGGRLDLGQAEAVAGLIAARCQGEARLALANLTGGLARGLAPVRQVLLTAAARVEAAIDFAEDLAPEETAGLEALAAELAAGVQEPLAELIRRSQRRRVFREGAVVVLCGRPNVGKSSLFNALLGRQRALVSRLAGTTRDTLEEPLVLGGVAVRLVDTAGLGWGGEACPSPAAELDELGRQAAGQAVAAADLLLVVMDGGQPLTPADREVMVASAGRPRLVAVNKADLAPAWDLAELGSPMENEPVLRVSAARGTGLEELAQRLGDALTGGQAEPQPGEVLAGTRQVEALERCRAAAERAGEQLRAGAWELVSLELGEALAALGEVDGLGASDQVIEAVFSQFCVGK
ncbi:MAG: tRNA uridine-5-carboxymethylaminomethyl(34) synthesis GTPase MnmE [Desulfarculus sp.]|nr:tRNA uridine-5-carboxymethylaminomethyl(34) synthesis GTPase MnmE [Desulfarculus sp.]